MIEAGEPEGSIQRLGQRVVIVELRTLQVMIAVVGVDDRDHLIGGDAAVVIFVPQNYNGAAALGPGRRGP